MRGLDEFSVGAGVAGTRVCRGAQEEVRTLLRTFERTSEGTYEKLIRTDPEQALHSVRSERETYDQVADRIFSHLPLPAYPPDNLRHFLVRALGINGIKEDRDPAFSVTYSGENRWQIYTGLHGGDIATLPVPFPETLSPLRWPLLVHELAHLLQHGDGRRLAAGATEDLARLLEERWEAPPGAPERLATELLADRVAYVACGQSYLCALTTEALMTPTGVAGRPSAILPAHLRTPMLADAHFRVAVMTGDLDGQWCRVIEEARGVLEDTAFTLTEGELEAVQEAVYGCLEGGAAERTILIMQAVKRLRPRNDGDVPPSPVPDTSAVLVQEVNRCLEDMPEAPMLVPDNDASMRQVLGALADGRPAPGVLPDFEGVRDASHVPATDADILTAAWMRTLGPVDDDRQRADWGSLLNADRELDDELVNAAQDKVVALDRNAAHSMESAAVYAFFHQGGTEGAASDIQVAARQSQGQDDSGLLADHQILARIALPPDDEKRIIATPVDLRTQLGAATMDLRLGTRWQTFHPPGLKTLDPGMEPTDVARLIDGASESQYLTAGHDDGVALHPGELVLALSLEYISLPADVWAILDGRSTYARVGLQVHASAGMIDPGFSGFLTFELQNTGRLPMVLFPGQRVGQLAFFQTSSRPATPYSEDASASYSAQYSAQTKYAEQIEHSLIARHRRESR